MTLLYLFLTAAYLGLRAAMTELIWSVRLSLDAYHPSLGLGLYFIEVLWICWGRKWT